MRPIAIALLALLASGCSKQIIKPITDYIDKNVKAFKATDINIGKLMANERTGRLALQRIARKTPAERKAMDAKADKLNAEIKRGRKIEVAILEGVKKIVGGLTK